jgi:hypothetical protein
MSPTAPAGLKKNSVFGAKVSNTLFLDYFRGQFEGENLLVVGRGGVTAGADLYTAASRQRDIQGANVG